MLLRTGHSYLHSAVPWLVLLVGLAAGVFLRRLARAFAAEVSVPRYTLSLGALWVACSVCLVGIFACQETLEGLFATGHPGGLEAVFGYGGWWSIPSAMCVGLVLAVWFLAGRWIVRRIAQSRARLTITQGDRTRPVPRLGDVFVPRAAGLAEGWSRRGPPRFEVSGHS